MTSESSEASTAEQVLRLARIRGVLRPQDVRQAGIPAMALHRLYVDGRLERVGRGLYVSTDAEPTELHMLAQTSRRIPGGVVCLLSALRFHDLTTQNPFEIWLAIDRKAYVSHEPSLPLRIVRFSGEALYAGIEEHDAEGVPVRVYNPAKTVADCFKYRNKIGLDVALEALRDTWRKRRATMDELFHFARVCRVANVMRPYLESLA